MLEDGRDQVHHRRVQQLRADTDHQRGRAGVGPVGVAQGGEDGVVPAEPELGSKLAVQRGAGRAGALLLRHLHQWPDALHVQPRAGVVGVRHDLHQQPAVRLLINHRIKLGIFLLAHYYLARTAVDLS